MVTLTRRRRVIEDDDNEEDSSKTMTVDERQSGTQVEERGENIAASTSMVDRLKRRAAKSAEVAQQKSKRKKSQQTEDNESIKNSPKKEQSIPKRPKKTQAIPKKSNDDKNKNKNGTKKEEDEVKKRKETPSLLSEMKKPPMPKANVSSKNTSAGGKGSQISIKNKTRPFHSLSPANVNVNVNAAASTPPATSANLADASGTLNPAGPVVKVEEGSGDKLGSGLRQLVFDGLKDLCKDAFEIPPERNGDFLFASFLRHKDLKPIMQTSSNNIDSSSNNSNNLRYDFFDVDETTRTIVMQPKIPIFPEDFPAGGIREWPLSWWGIVDPSIEKKTHEDKASTKNDADTKISVDAEKYSKSRRDRSGARSDGVKEGSGDRTRRENSRNTRKRPSRDIQEEEHAYYNDYPSREGRRDQFPGGEYDDGGDRYAPQLHGADYNYDYDHNGPSPDGYHPNSRNPHHCGDGQYFPRRTRDGPPAHSHPYHGDVPPPRDFRGGGRPYPTHGSSGPPPWEHSHRDPYGPQGRGPPPPRDDRRDHRDRSQRSPRSKPERDDGRHSVRKPSSSSSGRKDRTRSSR